MKEINEVIPSHFRSCFEQAHVDMDKLQEIRFRIGQAVELFDGSKKVLCKERVKHEDLKEMLEYISGYSLYAFEDEISQGFITIPGGHRVGVAGQVVVENGQVKNIRNISFINVRLSHQIVGCANQLMPHISEKKELLSTLIISPPRCGKTTLLRDIVRIVSGDRDCPDSKNVVVVDERSEIAGCFRGVPQNDLGCHTDVLDRCPKSQGMMMAIRSLSPDVIVADEIGSKEDVQAVATALNCGCKLLAAVHGKNLDEIRQKPDISKLFEEQMFERYVVLGCENGPGKIKEILDRRGRVMQFD